MDRGFFDNLLDSSLRRQKEGKRALTLPASIAMHGVILFAVVVVPFLSYNELPEPALGTVRAFFVEPTTAPAPPPPPPPAAPKAIAAPKVSRPRPVTQPQFVAPVDVPKEIPKDEGVAAVGVESAPAPSAGVTGGVEGGVPGGVEGGVPGGIVGGVLGGVPKREEAPPPPPDKPVRVGGQIKAPKKVRDMAPSYPEVAKQARVEGVVVLEAVISPEGRVNNVKVLRGNALLDDAAVNAVKEWVYSPTLLNGVPVPVVMTVTVSFKLS